jgi:periplasmic protein TonB
METNFELPISTRAEDLPPPVSVHVHVSTGNQTDHFLHALLATPVSEKKPRKPLKLVISLLLHAAVLAALVMLPLYFSQVLDVKAYQQTMLVAPPAPAPPPAPLQRIVHAVQTPHIAATSQLAAPTVVPKTVAAVKDAPPADQLAASLSGTSPDGVLGGVLGGSGTGPAAPPPATAPASSTPKVVRVGGDVKAPALLQSVSPHYPSIARAAHVEGDVIIDAVIDEHGNIIQAHAISGPAFLIAAALQAVTQWKYQPTFLNGQAVSIAMHVTVSFRLNHGA